MTAAWDRLLDLVDQHTTDSGRPLDTALETTVTALCVQAVAEGSIDRELDADDAGRWIVGLLAAHRAVRSTHPELAADHDLGVLRVILTRWLHPARPR